MREVRNLVVHIYFFGIGTLQRGFYCGAISRHALRRVGARDRERQLDGFRIVGESAANRGIEPGRGQTAQIRLVELNLQRFGRLTRHPPRLGHDGHRIIKRHYSHHTLA